MEGVGRFSRAPHRKRRPKPKKSSDAKRANNFKQYMGNTPGSNFIHANQSIKREQYVIFNSIIYKISKFREKTHSLQITLYTKHN